MSSPLSNARVGRGRLRSLAPRPLPRPRLTIVPKVAARAPRIPFVLLVVTVLGLGLVGLLLLNTGLQRGAYQLTDLRQTSSELSLRQQNLRQQVAHLQQPQQLANRALRLGMVRSETPAFLSLSTGRVIGAAAPGTTQPSVDLGITITTPDTGADKVALRPAGQQATGATPVVVHAPDRATGRSTGATTPADTEVRTGARELPTNPADTP